MLRFIVICCLALTNLCAETVLIIGDSLTAGYGVAEAEAWPTLVQTRLSASATTSGWRLVNAGISGDTTAGGSARIAKLLHKHKPKAVLIALGGNDGLRGVPAAEVEKHMERMLTAVRSASAAPLIAGMLQPQNFPAASRTAFAAVFTTMAAKHQAPLYPFLLDGVALDPALNQADRIHPNAAGHRVMAHKIHTWLAPILSSL